MFRRKKDKTSPEHTILSPSPEVARQTVVDTVNIIRGDDGPSGYILGQSLRPDALGRITLVEDEGSPHTRHYVYEGKNGMVHLDSELHVPGNNGKPMRVFRERTFSIVGGSWLCVTQERPREAALGIYVDAADVQGGVVRAFNSDAGSIGGKRQPIRPWSQGTDPRLPAGVTESLSPEELYKMTIVDRALKAAELANHHDLGRMTTQAVFEGAA